MSWINERSIDRGSPTALYALLLFTKALVRSHGALVLHLLAPSVHVALDDAAALIFPTLRAGTVCDQTT